MQKKKYLENLFLQKKKVWVMKYISEDSELASRNEILKVSQTSPSQMS